MLFFAEIVTNLFPREHAQMPFSVRIIAALYGGEEVAELSKNSLDFCPEESDECCQEEL